MANGHPGAKDILLPTGSYYFQKGGETHVIKCLTSSECVFFVSQAGKFDYMKAEK
jgi:beta-alanine degradation protein BauB